MWVLHLIIVQRISGMFGHSFNLSQIANYHAEQCLNRNMKVTSKFQFHLTFDKYLFHK